MHDGFRQEQEVHKQAGMESPQIPKILCGWYFGKKFWFLTKVSTNAGWWKNCHTTAFNRV